MKLHDGMKKFHGGLFHRRGFIRRVQALKKKDIPCKLFSAFLFSIFIFLIACNGNNGNNGKNETAEAASTITQSLNEGILPSQSFSKPWDGTGAQVNITTDDGVRLEGTLYHPSASKGILLLHMMGHDRTSYESIIPDLAKNYAVLALDLRGHGKSEGDAGSFSEGQFKAMIKDAAPALRLLGKKENAIIGASIGANIALVQGASDPSVKTLILLSPGLDYHGITTPLSMNSFNRPSLLIASKEDEYSAKTVQVLGKSHPTAAVEIFEGNKHGTDLFSTGTTIKVHIFKWLKANLGE